MSKAEKVSSPPPVQANQQQQVDVKSSAAPVKTTLVAKPKVVAPPAQSTVKVDLVAAPFKDDLKPVPNQKTTNIRFLHRQRLQKEHADLIKQTKVETANKALKKADARKKKKFIPKKPTRDERGRLRRARKHDTTAAPIYEKVLNDKYSIKKKPVAASAKPAGKK